MKMEIEQLEIAENKPSEHGQYKDSLPSSLVPSVQLVPLTKTSVSAVQQGSVKTDSQSCNEKSIGTPQPNDQEAEKLYNQQHIFEGVSTESINFDQYNYLSITKRGRGRPRKDGRTTQQLQHRKIFRGRGRPRRDDSSSKILHPKIFPGRPRVRARKFNKQNNLLPTTDLSDVQTVKEEIEVSCDNRDQLLSSDTTDTAPSSTEVSPIKITNVNTYLKKKCSLCNLTDASCLGQGKLKAFRPTPGFSPSKCSTDSSKFPVKQSDEPSDIPKLSLKNYQSLRTGPEVVRRRHRSLQGPRDKSNSYQNPFTELSNIGFDTPPEIKQVIQMTGETYVHVNCAIWSEGVTKVKDGFDNVDKAVLNGMFQKCAKCVKFGATVKCSVFDCDRTYHYSCAITSGALQNIKSFKIVCSAHTDTIADFDGDCVLCKTSNNLSDLLMCSLCFKYYHTSCLTPSVDSNSIIRAGWQCFECKTCQTCRQPGDENKMLVCESCDKGYHTFCLKPILTTVPKSGWKCLGCRVCGDCGARTPGSGPSSRWHLNYTVCDSCYQQRNKGVACPLCGKAYRQFSQRKEMRHCCVCRKYIHVECDHRADQAVNPLEYVCPICVNPVEIVEKPGRQISEVPLRGFDPSTPPEVVLSSSSHFTSENDNSFSSGESDSASELVAGKLAVKKRAKTADLRRRKKRPKSKLKSVSLPGILLLSNFQTETKEYKTEDDDPSADNRMVLVSTTDEFSLCQDLCVMCGSFGKGEEGRLIACAQCGQCYHSYCASIKVTSVVLKKGWRCLDCTVCEGCGQPHDEARLLLCDECDISFHIYCLDPPLKEVPQGNWKCKWCVVCVKCGSRSPGLNCNWQSNYTLCGPCSSHMICSVCTVAYEENDLIVQCSQCQRWSHGKCDQIENEENAEKCAEMGYTCILCRPSDELPPHLLALPSPPPPEPEPVIEKPPSPVPKQVELDAVVKTKPVTHFLSDGISLTETGMFYIQSLNLDVPKKIARPRKPRFSSVVSGSRTGSQVSMSYSSIPAFNISDGFDVNQSQQGPSSDVIADIYDKLDLEEDSRTLSADNQKDLLFEESEKKKKPRKLQKLGIGGFVLKPKSRSSITKELEHVESASESNQTPTSETPLMLGSENSETLILEKPKRRRKPKKKTPLDESFPSYLRDAFFGKALLTSCKKSSNTWVPTLQDDLSLDDNSSNTCKITAKDLQATTQPSGSEFSDATVRSRTSDTGQEAIISQSAVDKKSVHHTPSAMSSHAISQENLLSILNKTSDNGNDQTQVTIKEERDSRFSSGCSKEIPPLSDGTGFPQIDSKDVEDVIEGALRDQAASQASALKAKESLCNRMSGFLSDASNSPVHVSQPQSSSPFNVQRTSVHAQSSPIHRESTPSLHHQDSNSSWSESESSDQTQMQKNTMKWESDEPLGLLSTISPVLYANINCPQLKVEYPNWTDRVKQIAKIWRNLPSEKRQPYLQKARENRANSRTQKSTPSQEIDRGSKETKSQELDQEKQWKQFQALRQLQQQKQQKILQEKRAQALLKAHVDKPDTVASFDEADNTMKPGQHLAELNSPLRTPTHEQLLDQHDNDIKDNLFEKIYGMKWSLGSTTPKPEDANVLQQGTQLSQGKDGTRPQQGRPLAGPFIQVSRIRNPGDPSRVSVGEAPMQLPGTSSSLSPADHYPSPPSILSPRGLPHQHNRMPFTATSPVTRQSLLIPRSEMSRAPTPTLQKEILYTPPSTPRPQSSDSFFQGSVPARAQFIPNIDSQSSLTHKAPNVAQFQSGVVDSRVYNVTQNTNQYSVELTSLAGTISDVGSSKSFYSQSPGASVINKPNNQLQMHAAQIRIEDLNKNKGQPSPALQPNHFVHQSQVSAPSIPQNLPKVLQYKDDIYGTMPGTPRPSVSAQEYIAPHQSFEHLMLKENPDPNKLMAHHQLRELLQKQQLGNQEDIILQIRGKEASHLQQLPKGVYNAATLQFMSKDDCFRHPFPPSVRTRNLSAKDIKSELSPDILSNSNLKLDLLAAEDATKSEKLLQGANTVNLSSNQSSDSMNQLCPPIQKPLKKEADNLQLMDSVNKAVAPSFGKDGAKSNVQDVTETMLHKDSSSQQSSLELESKDDLCSQGPGKKRKTTAGDLVKDLEAHPEENDAIGGACSLDVLTADGELELDDDELLGLGNDFNILEYADPELDKGLVGEGEKSNILDEHLDLDDKDELEDEEEEMKNQAAPDEKEINPVVHGENKNFGVERPKVENVQKGESSSIDYLTIEKKEEKDFKTEFKDIECQPCQEDAPKSDELIKKETKVSYSSCSLSNVSFSDELSLKTEIPTVKEVHVSPQTSMSFGSPIQQNLGAQESVPTYSTQIGPPQYRLGNIVRQNLSPSNAPMQQPGLIPQPRNIFPLHVGLPLRQSVPVMQPNIVSSQSQQSRPLLLQEQPLLLEDLVEQEKREQLRQSQEGLISPQGDALLSDIDFERLKDDVFSGPPDDSLGGPGSLLGTHESLKTLIPPSQPSTSSASQNFVPPPYSLIWQNQEHNVPCPPRGPAIIQTVQQRPQISNVISSLNMPSNMVIHGEPTLRAVQSQKSPTVVGPLGPNFISTPPSPPVMDPHTEQEKQKLVQYEKFLLQQQAVLTSHQKFYEAEVTKLRKIKKALNAKQRALRKNGSELSENDAVELAKVSQEQSGLQKQLEQVRKQSRQHSIALQDYRMKHQKRQQQISQSPVHASISSLQSSPQSSHSPHQMGQTTPQSPMLPSSPMGPSPSRVQHSPSPLMQHSPAAISPSTIVGQPSPLVHSHMISQQVHFQVPRPEGKAWCNPTQMSQLPDNIQHGERYVLKDGSEKGTNGHHQIKQESKSIITEKPKLEQEPVFKRIVDNSEGTSMITKMEEPNSILKTSKIELGLDTDSTIDSPRLEDPNIPKSILSQSLPSSVTNTLNFTLRQTGMPTVCLPTDQNLDENTGQVNYLDLEPSKNLHLGVEQKISETKIKTEPGTGKIFPCESQPINKETECESLRQKSDGNDKEQQTSFHSGKHMDKTLENLTLPLSSKSETNIFNFDVALASQMKQANVARDIDSATHDKGEGSRSTTTMQSDTPLDSERDLGSQIPSERNFDNKQTNFPFGSALKSKEVIGNSEKDSANQNNTGISKMAIDDTRKDVGSGKGKFASSVLNNEKSNNNEASSDEELESLSRKSLATAEGDQDPGKQNVLLKQLLQNYPSAETPITPEDVPDVKKEESGGSNESVDVAKKKTDDVKSKSTAYGLGEKSDDSKSKKLSYLDIRRAQLEKEPTPPPPGTIKIKTTAKRKRPKKKKVDCKDGSPAKKKCRKGLITKQEEIFGAPLESIATQLTSLPPSRILEPNIKPNFNILSIFGSGDLNSKGNQLKGCYGSSVLPNQSDIYAHFPYGKDHAAPILALPPSPPYRGFYNQEFPHMSKGKLDINIPTPQEFDTQNAFRDCDSPDTIISSSSPECCLFEPVSKCPKLMFIDCIDQELEQKKSYSPVVPLITPIPIRFSSYSTSEFSRICDLDKEKDKENIPRSELKSDISLLKSKFTTLGGYSTPLKDAGNVSVTLTLSSTAADDICGVLSRLADVLKIPIPATYEIVERTATPPSQKLGLYRKTKNSDMNIHSLLNGKPRFCRHCDIVVLSAGIRKKACDLTCISKEEQDEEEDEVIFCSTNCYMQFALTHRASGSALEDKEAAAVVSHPVEKAADDCCTAKSEGEEDTKILTESMNMKYESKALSNEGMHLHLDTDDVMDIKPMKNSSGKHFEQEHSNKVMIKEIQPQKWKSVKYKYFSASPVQAFKSTKDEPAEKITKPFYSTIKVNPMPKDLRKCIFCHIVGDGDANGVARLLNMDVDKWVHLNCALWSAEVYETVNGALVNVEIAFKRAMLLTCSSCQKFGASLKCFKIRCTSIYHFACAMKEHCVFFKDKTLMCSHHANKCNVENELESVVVDRRVYIDRDEHKQVASMIQSDQYVMRVGSLIFMNIGQLLPQQMQAFHTANCIYPVGYKVIRMYWSMRKLGKRCQYICSISDINGKPEFQILVKEPEHKDIVLKDKTSKGLWQKVIYPIEKMRRQAKTIKIFPDFITGDDLFGLNEPAVLRIIESLPGVDTLMDYNFRYGRSPFLELPLAINPTGCARSEPKLRTHVKRSHTLHTSNSSRASFHSTFGGIEISSPYIKQFVHSKSSQYRKMKTEWRNNVYLARSRIQGLGLYAARDIEKHTMVIEYIGQLIRNEIAERNEGVYNEQNRGVYMFRLDENRVIDATLSGGLARYMNHSCNPNCVAEVVQIDRENKILIIANRRITRGEELSYDYKFEVEDDQHKIPCLCKAPNCRKWMN